MTSRQLQKLVEKIPSSIRITKDVSYEVVFVDEFSLKDVVGECRYDKKQIALKTNQSKSEMLSSLLHETLHAIEMENEIGLTENEIVGLELGLFRFLKLNGILQLLSKL